MEFATDEILPSQWADLHRRCNHNWLKALMLGLLEISLYDAHGSVRALSPSGKSRSTKNSGARLHGSVPPMRSAGSTLMPMMVRSRSSMFVRRSGIDSQRLRERLAGKKGE